MALGEYDGRVECLALEPDRCLADVTGAVPPSASREVAWHWNGTPRLWSSVLGTAVRVDPVPAVTSRSWNSRPWESPTAMVTVSLPIGVLSKREHGGVFLAQSARDGPNRSTGWGIGGRPRCPRR